MTSSSSGWRRVDAYDERGLQTKALNCWQRQHQAWEKMSASLKSRSCKRHPKTLNFDLASYQTREKQEDLALIYAAVPQSVFSNYYTWESMLRCTSDDAMRYVQIGKSYYPYALFGEVRDATVLKSNHPIYTRMIGEKYVKESDELYTSRARARDSVRRSLHIGPYLDKNEPDRLAAEQDGGVTVNPSDCLSHTDYYEQRLRLFAPFIQRRFSHFLLPRQALGVQGKPAPVNYGGGAHTEDPDPVQYYPPPPQQLTLPSSTPPGDARSVSNQVLGFVPTPRSGDGASSTKAADDISSIGGLTGDAEEEPQPFDSGRAGPSLVLSTKRLLFYAHPGELVHGRVLVQNKSHVTVYYTWMPLDLLAGYLTGAEGDDAPSDASSDPRESLQELGHKLHSLAHHSRSSQNFFRFSRHVNGVILPEEEDIFPFSLRAPYPGRFKAAYELLTIPPTPTRIIVELAAVVKVSASPAQTLAKPVEEALNAKVTRNTLRHQVQHLVRTQTPYDEADMYRAIEVIHEAKRNVIAAEKTKRALEKETWKAANMYTFDDIPYNAAVYDSLLNLREQLKAAMITVGSPLRHDTWNSSLNELVGDICTLRDSPSRIVYYDAMMVLLRAARVADTENERLDALLQKAAEAAAVQLEERRLNLFSSEAELLQLPKEPVPASTAAAGLHKRSQSMIRKPRDRHSRNDSVSPVPIPGTFRKHLRGVTLTPEEEDALHVERESMINAFREGVLAEHPALVASLLSNYRAAVESACYLPLSQVVEANRAAAIVTIQKSERIDVDCSSEVSLKAAGGKKK